MSKDSNGRTDFIDKSYRFVRRGTHFEQNTQDRSYFINIVIAPTLRHSESIEDTILDYLGGIRSTCAYINAHKIKHMSKCVTFVVVSQQLNTHLVK